MTIYNYGSINIDHVYRVPHLVKPGETLLSSDYQTLLGGKGANQSIALAKAGAEVVHIGRYNESDVWVKQALNEVNVDCCLLQVIDVPTGHAIIQVNDEGQNSIILFSGANHSFSKSDIEALLQTAKEDDWLLLQNECNQLDFAIEVAVSKGMQLVINTAPMSQDILDLPLDKFKVILANEVEAATLFGITEEEVLSLPENMEINASTQNVSNKINQAIQKTCPTTDVIITLGSKGSAGWDGTRWYFSPAHTVPVVDTTAAGDTFTGYFLAAFSQGENLEASMNWASKASALCVQTAGASTSIPTALDVNNKVGE